MRVRMTGFTINQKEIDKKVANSRAFQKLAKDLAHKKAVEAQKCMIQEFNEHVVTKELEIGPEASNASGTLSGYGNLFSFMGFQKGSNPVGEVRKFLQKSIKIKRKKSRGSLIQEFRIETPTIESFKFASMPWEGGNSWVESIEKGMSSFSYFMHKAYQSSRSGVGMQIDNKLRGRSSAPVKYMSLILNNFRKRLIR